MAFRFKLNPAKRGILLSGASIAMLFAATFPAVADDTETKKIKGDAVENVVVTGKYLPNGSAESGYRQDKASLGPLGTASFLDTPYSLNVTSGELIENTAATTLMDALKTNPTVAVQQASGWYASMTGIQVRGFSRAEATMRDGLIDRAFTFVPIENVDRIETLSGFSGFLYGFAGSAGSVNMVSKRPTENTMLNFRTGVYARAIGFAHIDTGGPLTDVAPGLGHRLNAYYENGESMYKDGLQKRTFLSERVEYTPLKDVTLWGDAWFQEYGQRGLATALNPSTKTGVPDAVLFDPSRNYGQNWTRNISHELLLGTGLDAKLSDIFGLRFGYRYCQEQRDYNYIQEDLIDAAGNYTEKYYRAPRQHETTHSAYALIDAHLATWGVTHDITAGYSSTNYAFSKGIDVGVVLGTSNIFAPVYFADPQLIPGGKTQTADQFYYNLLIGDHIVFSDAVSLLAGVNYASLRQYTYSYVTGAKTSVYSLHKATPSVSLIYKPLSNLSAYVSYIESVAGGESTSSTTAVNANQVLPPSTSTQYEIGTKATLHNVMLSIALFRINKVNAEIDPRDNIFKQDGREIHQGAEFTITGKLLDHLTAVGGFTWLDARVEKATANTATEGKTPVNVPERQARAFLEYELPFLDQLFVSVGANYSGKRPVDVYNTNYMKGATTYDAGIRYSLDLNDHKLTFNLVASNIANTAYWSYYSNGTGLMLGAPRNISFSVKGDW